MIMEEKSTARGRGKQEEPEEEEDKSKKQAEYEQALNQKVLCVRAWEGY